MREHTAASVYFTPLSLFPSDVVQLYNWYRDSDAFYIAMELVSTGELFDYLRKNELSEADVKLIFVQVRGEFFITLVGS